MSRRARFIGLALCCVSSLASAVACRGSSQDKAAPSASAVEPAPVERPASEVHEPMYDVVFRPSGAYVAGTKAAAEIVVQARGAYHANDNYPYKFKVSDSPGVRFGAPVFDKSAVRLEEKSATMTVDFTPESSGEKTLNGVLSFSVCSPERCLVEKQALALKIAVN